MFDENKPEGVPFVIETVVEQVDSLVQPVRGNEQDQFPLSTSLRSQHFEHGLC